MGGVLDVRVTTTFHFTDGCDWVSTQRLLSPSRPESFKPTLRTTPSAPMADVMWAAVERLGERAGFQQEY